MNAARPAACSASVTLYSKKYMNDDSELPDSMDFDTVGSDHNRQRASRGWLNETLGLCVVSFAMSSYDVATSIVRTGYPAFPHLISSILFGMAIASIRVSFLSLGDKSTLSEHRQRSWRTKLVIAAVLVLVPVVVGGVGELARIIMNTG